MSTATDSRATGRNTPGWLANLSGEELERQLTDDPYPLYERMRAEAPVVWLPQMQAWFVTRYDDVRAVAFDSEHFHGAADPAQIETFGAGNVLTAEGDFHTEQRAFIDPQLRKRKVPTYIEPLVRPTVDKLIEGLKSKNSADIVAEYFEPVSVRALGDLLGLESVDSATLQRWFRVLGEALVSKGVDDDGNLTNTEAFERANVVKEEIRGVVLPIIERVTAEPDESSLSHWVHDGTDTPRSGEELWPTLYVFLLGAMQEPGHAAGNTLHGLFSRPDQLAELRADRSLLPKAIDEGLRWIAPIGAYARVAVAPQTVGGEQVATDEIVFGSMGSANRDESRWPDPDTFDIHRPPQVHMAFSGGVHTCAGSHFGKAVEEIALGALLDAFPDIAPDGDATTRGWFFRAVQSLPVRW
ncbi:cytochrome P450 [Epidermidibacterium keratini]|uniref:Cytochrome P450 n=1 Tax=Epidermidibacterium keratini TaxID=1891644 RepID=A0A7L4YKS0_9ACTN|nr:cytochrome P450 [Epidermidibacterium keratini]QHB99795.1 cytochrome P450 [Epidermidibacterium keratini]